MTRYHVLFEVKFFHSYYDSYSSKDLEIVATNDTKDNLSSYQLIYKKTDEGFVVFYKEDKVSLLGNLKYEISFNFILILKNRYFRNYSNISSINLLKKYIFNNFNEINEESGSDELNLNQKKLHENGFVDEKNVCLYCHGNDLLKDLFSNDEVLIKQVKEVIFEGKLEGWESAAGILGDNYGIYDVMSKGSKISQQLQYIQASPSNTFGTVNISVGGQTTGFESVKGSEYLIKFESRSIFWSYYFVMGKGKHYESVDLFSGKIKLKISEPEEVVLANGKQAMKVTSLETIPLKKSYENLQIFAELIEQLSDGANEVVKKKVSLPTPDITRIKGTINNDTETYFSEMYIYL